MNFVANAPGITIVGIVGSANSTGTGTRYNELEWDANTNAIAFSPNIFSGPMASGAHKGIYGSAYSANDGVWDPSDPQDSLLGHLVINVGPGTAGTNIILSPVDVLAATEEFEDFTVPVLVSPFTILPNPLPLSCS
jgi:hypothetical protein